MSNWLFKSNNSFGIANTEDDDVLINNRVHCHYYGCVLLLKHVILKNFHDMDVLKVETECNRLKTPENKGTHQYIKLTIKEDLNKKSERIKSLDFNSSLTNLQNLRTKADYSIDNITADEMVLAKKYSDFINTTIHAFYKV